MKWLYDCWRSSIGSKVTMAVTGLLLFGFVVAHLIGNLQLLAGPAKINAYAKMLHDLGPLLWVARIGLLAIFALHVATAVRLARENRAARPVGYRKQATIQATFASRSMVLTGLSLLAFVIYHLLHFTLGVTNPGYFAMKQAGAGGFDVHAMVSASFQSVPIALAYVAFMVVLFFHLAHGIQSLFQSLGLRHARYTALIDKLSYVFAALVAGGNVFLALSVQLGIVKVTP